MELTENVLDRDGCLIHYWTGGKADAQLVVFTHGATIDHEWDASLPLVEAAGFRVLAWDMRGHGLSRPARFDFSAARADLMALLDIQSVEKEATGNIRKAMPLWGRHEGVELIVIPNAKHAANLDQPEIFHKYLLDFLQPMVK
jgi:pimeloyl-ACP methyl ester carboxylesterase